MKNPFDFLVPQYAGFPELDFELKQEDEKHKFLNFKGGGKGGLGGIFGGIGDVVGGIVGAITGANQTQADKDIARAQAQAQQQAMQQQIREQQLQEQANNKANSNAPQYAEDGFYDRYSTDNIFTGVTGLDQHDYTLGKNSLLGTGRGSMGAK